MRNAVREKSLAFAMRVVSIYKHLLWGWFPRIAPSTNSGQRLSVGVAGRAIFVFQHQFSIIHYQLSIGAV
jgi:hypothetical protein